MQAVRMIHKDMNVKHATIEKLHKELQTINANYKLERGVTQAKNVRIWTLERVTLELSSNPGDIIKAKKLLQDKDNEIAKLKKESKLPGSHPSEMSEIFQIQEERDEINHKFLEAEEQYRKHEARITMMSNRLSSIAETPSSSAIQHFGTTEEAQTA